LLSNGFSKDGGQQLITWALWRFISKRVERLGKMGDRPEMLARDPKSFQVFRGMIGYRHLFHLSGRGTLVAPAEDFLHLAWAPFKHGFNPSIPQIANPTVEFKQEGRITGGCSVANPLHKSRNKDMSLDKTCVGF